MRIKLIDSKCMPTKNYVDDAGYDLKIRKGFILEPFSTTVIPTGVCVKIPLGYSGDIRPRSSISKRGLLVHYGTVDSGYTGEIHVTITNLTNRYRKLEQYERVAQIVVHSILLEELELVDELPVTKRGNNGYGSTGTI